MKPRDTPRTGAQHNGQGLNGRALLLAAGFTCQGVCQQGASIDRMLITGQSERKAGVYAYVVGDEVRYVGAAQRGLHARLKHYENTQRLRTAARIRAEVLKEIAAGQIVEVFTLVPPAEFLWHGLPVNLVAGIEGGLIRALRPLWNVRGLGGDI
ncbi:GIY-YIG nuclease family protein [Methylocystis sp. WRRC1]|uniref:GIY-YIG nuclease family protein n=1 Tax=Methylocystis sp. WRRC1 TaxID=1732014 RepID=UPI001D1541E5|nr:GIY-YIG nuclease family protein [Methylocystis sp. WRRC1]MCC3245435.1 GIY-YIG nuclease family protein [Methylocystis sp. WRRC1]